jgi:hypothetical protein
MRHVQRHGLALPPARTLGTLFFLRQRFLCCGRFLLTPFPGLVLSANLTTESDENLTCIMKLSSLVRRLFPLLLLASLLSMAGCSSCKPGKGAGKPKVYTLKVSPGASLKDISVPVDVIGIHPADLERFKTYSVRKYFKANDLVRQDAAKVTARFVPDRQEPLVLKSTDPQWTKWISAGAQYLVIIADLPSVNEEGKVGSQDPRRQLIPICECYWPSGSKEIAVEVQAGGVRLLTSPREGWSLPPW